MPILLYATRDMDTNKNSDRASSANSDKFQLDDFMAESRPGFHVIPWRLITTIGYFDGSCSVFLYFNKCQSSQITDLFVG